MPDFAFSDLLPIESAPDQTPYRLLTTDGVSTLSPCGPSATPMSSNAGSDHTVII
jgi:hypothetical protein